VNHPAISAVPTLLDIAFDYIRRGWNPVPVRFKSKDPSGGEGWHHVRINTENAGSYFNGGNINIGVQMGAASNGLSDVDLDCAEALVIAPYVLPPTGSLFGRASKRFSHRLYVTRLAQTEDKAGFQHLDPRIKGRGGMLIELRIGGADKGAQTVFPGSVHESGENIVWEEDGEPATVGGDELLRKVRAVAAYCLLARHYPTKGSGHHNTALVVGGFLARAGDHPAIVRTIMTAIAKAAHSDRWQELARTAEDAAKEHCAGRRAYGYPTLAETFGEDIARKVAEWLDYDCRGETHDEQETASPLATLTSARASTVAMRAIQWIWPGRFAVGKLGLLVGLPDEGKGQILCYVAATITNGDEWPCGEGRAPKGRVILLTAEDDIADTVNPRLLAAGANLDEIEIIRMVHEKGRDRMFNLVSDLDLLRRKVIEVGNVRMVLIDPVSAYLGVKKMDSFRTTDVRAVLGPVVGLATEMQVGFLGVMHFNKKVDVTNALLRISDSMAFGATSRHAYAVIDDPENKRKLLVKAKNNLAPRNQKALAYDFGTRNVGSDPETKEEIWAPYVLWHPHPVDVTATEAMRAANESKSPAARDDAKNFLENFLADGPKLKTEIEEAADANCISERTLRRAKSDLGIVAEKTGLKEGWIWRLPSAGKQSWVDGD
jgi:hypothetical protein